MMKFTKNLFTDKKINFSQQADYLTIISKLLRNGFSLSQSINCLCLLDGKNSIFEKINADLRAGKTISQALLHLQLPTVIFNQLAIAQDHGKFELALERTGILLKSQAKQRNKLKELLIYPCFILFFLTVMLIGMKVYIIPQLALTTGGKNIDLFLKMLILAVLVSASIIIVFFVKVNRKTEYQKARVLVKVPLIGKIYLCFYQFLLLQGLGMQLASGMNLFDVCESNKQFQRGSIQNYLANKFVKAIINGDDVFYLIEKEPLLPNQLRVVLQSGESGLQLAEDLLLMSELKFEETQKLLKKILNSIQPLLFCVIAIVIVVTYLIILLPIYGMMKGMS